MMTSLKWKLVSVLSKIVLILTQDRCTVCARRTIGSENHFGPPDGTITRLKWKLVLVLSKIVLILTQDRCTVCFNCTTGSEIIFDAPDGTRR
jgi:hypothetical protein